MTRMKALWPRLKWWLIGSGLLIAILLGVVAIKFWRSTIPPQPTEFYTPPDPLPAGAPGDIIRREAITENLPEGAVAWRVLYLSTGLNGEPVAVSGLIIAPEGGSNAPRPVIAWAQGTQGILPECGTSHRDDPFEFFSVLDLMISEGFVVAATDYPGRGTPGIHPYLIGPIEAHAVLDSVRAARQMEVNADSQFAIWGASQGGHATLWAAQSAADYAPELTLVGAAAQASAIDLPGIFKAVMNEKIGGALLPQAMVAWSMVYPDAHLDSIIKPEQRDQFERLARTCVSTPTAYLRVGNILTPAEFLAVDPLTAEPWQTIITDNIPGGPITVPLLITHGTADPLIPFEGSVNEAARRCAEGEDVTFMRFPGVTHPGSDDTGVTTVGWIEDRFAGRPTGSTCEQ